jgi:hypothetical protein
MRVKVMGIVSSGRHPRLILAHSVGTVELRCHVRGQEPAVGNEYDIELTIDDRVEMNREAFPARVAQAAIRSVERRVHLTGSVDGADEDGVFYFRLAADSLTMIEGAPGSFHAGQWISLELEDARVMAYFI